MKITKAVIPAAGFGTSPEITASVIYTGVYTDHPSLVGRLVTGLRDGHELSTGYGRERGSERSQAPPSISALTASAAAPSA